MTGHRLVSAPRADLDVEAAFEWYENERSGLGLEFLDELRATYDRIADGPLKYQLIRSESGEDYLYPSDYFVALDLPREAERALAGAVR